MTFTYTPKDNPGATVNDRDKVRFLIGDTDSTLYIFEDEELDMFSADVYTWAGDAMMAIASDNSKIATMCSIGNRDFVSDRKSVAKECREQANKFYEKAKTEPYATEVELEDPLQDHLDDLDDSRYNFDLDLELNE